MDTERMYRSAAGAEAITASYERLLRRWPRIPWFFAPRQRLFFGCALCSNSSSSMAILA